MQKSILGDQGNSSMDFYLEHHHHHPSYNSALMVESGYDIVRWFVLIEAALIEGMAYSVMLTYFKRWRSAVSHGTGGRRGSDTPWIGLLPGHVWKVALGTIVLVAAMAAHVVLAIGDREFAWHTTPGALVGFTLIIIALWDLLHYEHRLIEPHGERRR